MKKDKVISRQEFEVNEGLAKLKKEKSVKSTIDKKTGEELFSLTDKGIKRAAKLFEKDFGSILFLFKVYCQDEELGQLPAKEVFEKTLKIIPLRAKANFVFQIEQIKEVLNKSTKLGCEVKFVEEL